MNNHYNTATNGINKNNCTMCSYRINTLASWQKDNEILTTPSLKMSQTDRKWLCAIVFLSARRRYRPSPSTLDPNTSGSPAAVVPCVGSEALALCNNARRPPTLPPGEMTSARDRQSPSRPPTYLPTLQTPALLIRAGRGGSGGRWIGVMSPLAKTGSMLPFRLRWRWSPLPPALL